MTADHGSLLVVGDEPFLREAVAAWTHELGDSALLQDDPHFCDLIPFHEYFHGDSGKGLGAAHQTGWTGLVALLLQPRVNRMGSLMAVAETPETPAPSAAPSPEAARR